MIERARGVEGCGGVSSTDSTSGPGAGILGGMAARKTEPEPRKKSLLTLAGDAARAKAQRELLLKTLRAHDWNLTATAEALEMTSAADVARALRELAPEEYESARERGDISRATRADRT